MEDRFSKTWLSPEGCVVQAHPLRIVSGSASMSS